MDEPQKPDPGDPTADDLVAAARAGLTYLGLDEIAPSPYQAGNPIMALTLDRAQAHALIEALAEFEEIEIADVVTRIRECLGQ